MIKENHLFLHNISRKYSSTNIFRPFDAYILTMLFHEIFWDYLQEIAILSVCLKP